MGSDLARTAEPVLDRADILHILKTGDLSRLNDEQQLVVYVHECRRMGLDPAARPLEWAKLQGGKLALYAKRVAGDMLAAKHRVTCTLTAGPEVRDFGGTKLLYAAGRATMPDGRSVEDVATLPLTDVANGVMKVVTKTFRRATLRLCGWGGLDESELETIPGARSFAAHDHAAALPVAVQVEPAEHPALARFRDELDSVEHLDGLRACWRDNARDVAAADDTDGTLLKTARAMTAEFAKRHGWARTMKEVDALMGKGEATAAQPTAAAPADVPTPPDPVVQAVEDYAKAGSRQEVDAIAAECAKLGLAKDDPDYDRLVAAYRAACARFPPPPKPRGREPAANDAPAGDDPERDAIAAEGTGDAAQAKLLAAINRLRACESSAYVVNHYGAHLRDLPPELRPAYRADAIQYLTARYKRAVPTAAVASELLDHAAARSVMVAA